MLSFDKENKITLEQLSFSLQDKLRKIVPKTEIKKVENILTLCENSLNGVRFSFVDNLRNVDRPVNNADVAILNSSALELYAYSNNRWIRIPNQDIFYRFDITQSEHQTISVTTDNKKYQSSLNLRYGAVWSASITPESKYYKAGRLSKVNGVITEADEVHASPATLIKDFYLSMVVGKKVNGESYGIRLNWSGTVSEEELYGSLDPEMFDALSITKSSSGTYSTAIAFYGDGPTTDMYDRISIYLIYDEQSHDIVTDLNLSDFNDTGDIYNIPSFTNQYFFDLFKSLKGKKVQIYVHFDKD